MSVMTVASNTSCRYDSRYGTPSGEVLRKIELSRREVEGMSKRDLKCPICGFRIQGIYADRTGHAEVKCRKCKFEGPLNLAYFRKQQRTQKHIRFPKIARCVAAYELAD